jgi:hypothetical protein
LACEAPSLHNSQPWTFRAEGNTIELRADPTRALPFTDPTGRELTISCGAALQHLEVALRVIGIDPQVTVIDSARDREEDENLLARVDVSRPGVPSDEVMVMAHQILLRRSNRHPFEARPVDPEVLRELIDLARCNHVTAVVLNDVDRVRVGALNQKAEQIEQGYQAYQHELHRWTAADANADDGINLTEIPADADHSGIAVRDFALSGATADGDNTDRAPVLLMVGTLKDDRRAHLAAGRALGAILLSLSAAGLAASMHSQLLELWTTRSALRRISPDSHPQMLVRIGHCQQRGSATRRRPVADVLTFTGGVHLPHPNSPR